jgi:hypothetical protein
MLFVKNTFNRRQIKYLFEDCVNQEQEPLFFCHDEFNKMTFIISIIHRLDAFSYFAKVIKVYIVLKIPAEPS